MVIRKTLGYVLSGLGVVGLASWSFEEVKKAIPDMEKIVASIGGDTVLLIISAVLLILGIFIVVKAGGGRKKTKNYEDVPVFRGESQQVVGYRRHK